MANRRLERSTDVTASLKLVARPVKAVLSADRKIGSTRAGDLFRRAVYSAAILGAVHGIAPRVVDSRARYEFVRQHPAPVVSGVRVPNFQSTQYSPFTVVLPHESMKSTYATPGSFKYTYIPDYSRLVNSLVDKEIARLKASSKYPMASQVIDSPFMHAVFMVESKYNPSAYFKGDGSTPTDVGLGQVTSPGLAQARDDGAVAGDVKRVRDLMTVPHPLDFDSAPAGEDYQKQSREAIWRKELEVIAKRLGKPVASLTRSDLAVENRRRLSNNIKASVDVAFYNLEGFLKKAAGVSSTLPDGVDPVKARKGFDFLSYKNGPRITAVQYSKFAGRLRGMPDASKNPSRAHLGVFRGNDGWYAKLRENQTEEVANLMRFVVPPIKKWHPPLYADAAALIPWLGWPVKWSRRKRSKASAKATKT